ncbi:hypothetical protein JCM3765_003464 [Sporobolomyces pararoseus]
MVKVISGSCSCSICSRRGLEDLTAPLPTSTSQGSTSKQTSTRDLSPKRAGPIASNSSIPYSTPLALALPNEILLEIFRSARPESTSRVRDWYARLALVHSRWSEAAQDCLARVVVIRRADQLEKLEKAIRNGRIGARVEEIVLDLRDASSGKSTLEEEEDKDPIDSALLKLFEVTQGKLLKLRLQGFGIKTISSIPKALASSFATLTTFEFSPLDAAHPLTSTSLFNLLYRGAASLKTLSIHPRSYNIVSLGELSEESMNLLVDRIIELDRIRVANGQDFESSEELHRFVEIVTTTARSGTGAARLEHLSFSCVSFSPNLFLGLTLNSFDTITSLNFTSVIITGNGLSNYQDFFSVLSLLVSEHLLEFKWEDPLFSLGGEYHTFLPEEPFWNFLRRCKKLRKLTIFSSLVFKPPASSAPSPLQSPPLGTATSTPPAGPSKPSRDRFSLPPELEELNIGSARSDIKSKRIVWWMKRVVHLLQGKQIEPEEEEEEFETFLDYHDAINSLFDPSYISPPVKPPRYPPTSFKEFAISLPASCRPHLRSSSVKEQLSQINTTFKATGKKRKPELEGEGDVDGEGREEEKAEQISIRIGYIELVTLDQLELTREMRMTM